ncbi:MAG: flagellar hook-length control protein FliK, partial [Salinisphaera sp.]|nr:flagellar hook-length control protein FliK [Salinisphaera sp.]
MALQMQSVPAVGTVLHLRVEGRGAEVRLVPVPGAIPGAAGQGPVVKLGALPSGSGGTAPPGIALPSTTGAAPQSSAAAGDAAKTALNQIVQNAIGRQASLGPALQTVQALGPVLAQMPEPVRRLATQLLAKSLKLDGQPVDAAALQKAVRQSGIFQEARLAGGAPAGAVQTDTKAELQALSRALRTWVGGEQTSGVRIQGTPPPSQQPAIAAPAGPIRESARLLLERAETALAQMRQGPVGRRAGLALLAQTIQNLGPALAQMPEPARRIAVQLLARSGSATGEGSPKPAGPLPETLLSNPAKASAPPDAEADLRMLSRSLGGWLNGETPHVTPVRPAVPARGAPPRAPARIAASLPPDSVQDGARMLLEQTEDALSRVRLLQNASLPDEAARHHQAAEWNLDLPVMLNGQPNVMPFQIQRDDGAEHEGGERGWRVRFALDLGERGEAGAQISLRGGRVGVMLWAAEVETTALMEEGLGWLSAALVEAGLTAGTMVCRHGAPETPARVP